ncbi:hypothetical protein [Nonomuraea sp. NPDC005650]|uniref:hypothetical protein n=1 Tax=Nonomuraea sp. NPDC005650 TaxID=3157045 RepID=UPI0033B4D784
MYVCDRVLRCAQEQAARTLRLALHRRRLVKAIVATWPASPWARTDTEWTALRKVLPDGVSAADIRNRTRQIRAHRDAHGALLADLTELEEPPASATQIVLAAADRQLITLERTDQRNAHLRVRLPLADAPACRRDWAWHLLPITLPPTVPPEATLCTPTLRVSKGRVRVDLPFQIPIAFAPATGHVIGCGFDWGLNTLLTGTVARLVDGRVLSDGRPLAYDATGISAKLHRLRAEREHLATKHKHQETLLAGITVTDPRFAQLSAACLRHCSAPDRLTEKGWTWAYCPACGLSCDRDHAAAERIVARGLLGQHVTRIHRTTGTRTIGKAVEGNVARARRARRPTRAARRARRTRTDLHPRPAHGARPAPSGEWTASGGPCTQAGTAPAEPDRACQEFSPPDRLPPRPSHPRAHTHPAQGRPTPGHACPSCLTPSGTTENSRR